MTTKDYLDFLYYEVGHQHHDFRVSYLMKEHGKNKASKWKKYSEVCFNPNWKFLEKVNQRECLMNEIILDIEDKQKYDITIEILEKYELKYLVYTTHSNGFHVHLFYYYLITEQQRIRMLSLFEADLQIKIKHMIALENTIHWKSGKDKELIKTNIKDLKDVRGYFND